MLLPAPIQNLIEAFSRLPGVGPKTASRLTFHLLHAPDEVSLSLAEALQALKSGIGYCQRCYNITAAGRELCEVCANPARRQDVVCVVEAPLDVIAIERTDAFDGVYHVLHGALSPIEGIGPENLKLGALFRRLQQTEIREIILATNPSMEGDATAMYIQRQLAGVPIRITRLARGLPVGGDLEYTDQSTLLRALLGRQEMG
ncbi:MAG: recombination mediator RecR [Anaerolineales bacterium]